jgi:hypothetical protein
LKRPSRCSAGDGTLKERLAAAYREHLDDIDELELPHEVHLEYSQMSRTMHLARALPGDNVVRASVRKMSSDEAEKHAALVVHAFAALARVSAPVVARAPARRKPRKQQQLDSAIIKVSPIVKLFARDG